MKQYAFLSFRDPDKNLNLGACIVEADNTDDAVSKAWKLEINPGGEVLCFILSQEDFDRQDMDLNRLYTRQQLLELGYQMLSREEQ